MKFFKPLAFIMLYYFMYLLIITALAALFNDRVLMTNVPTGSMFCAISTYVVIEFQSHKEKIELLEKEVQELKKEKS